MEKLTFEQKPKLIGSPTVFLQYLERFHTVMASACMCEGFTAGQLYSSFNPTCRWELNRNWNKSDYNLQMKLKWLQWMFLSGDRSLSGSTTCFCETCVCCSEKSTYLTKNRGCCLSFSSNPCRYISDYCTINCVAFIWINCCSCMICQKAKWALQKRNCRCGFDL